MVALVTNATIDFLVAEVASVPMVPFITMVTIFTGDLTMITFASLFTLVTGFPCLLPLWESGVSLSLWTFITPL